MNLENNMSCEISVIWIEVVSNLQPLFLCCNQLKTIYYEYTTNRNAYIIDNNIIVICDTHSNMFC